LSGFVAVFRTDGSPADPALLQAMTEFLSVRGPDAQAVWFDGPAGLGHALLRTTRESAREHQPLTFDGRVRIVADARLDAREELCAKINARLALRPPLAPDRPDVEILLHAYEAWGESCVEHLFGDFSFVIWDAEAGRTFCARDQMGNRPLFYARTPHALLIGNTLEALRIDPEISDQLDDSAIADFLVTGNILGPTATAFRDISRLPAAHILTGTPENFVVRRYWTLPIEEPLRRRGSEIVEEFRALLREAVRDRLRTNRATISMSGGLDSTAVAGVACDIVGKPAAHEMFRGITYVFERAMPDQEGHFATLAAAHFGFPITLIALDRENFWDAVMADRVPTAEPVNSFGEAIDRKWQEAVGPYGRVQLTGHGGDIILTPSLTGYRGRRFPLLIWATGRYAMRHGRLPQAGYRLAWRRWRGHRKPHPQFPAWLNPDLVARFDLRDRWEQWYAPRPRVHPFRPDAYASLTSDFLQRDLESYDTGARAKPVESRHPLFDLRLVRFCLRLPAVPWCSGKQVLRAAMRGVLPDAIRRRPKTPLAVNSVPAMSNDGGQIHSFRPASGLEAYVASDYATTLAWTEGISVIEFRPLFLNLWLQTYRRFRYTLR
jgi:asparagine synthase (glutamine-hydrolysing)